MTHYNISPLIATNTANIYLHLLMRLPCKKMEIKQEIMHVTKLVRTSCLIKEW